MKANLAEAIIYDFAFEEIEKAKSFKDGHLKNGFTLVSEYFPTSKEDMEGYFKVEKKTTFSKK